MGEVWRAEDTRLGRVVAIKVLPPAFAADVEAIARLKREARTAAQLYHPSIATIHSIEQDGDHIFIVEEFVEGDPLTKVISRGGLSEAEICRIGRAVADALAEAHAKGIVHRDIKPDNIVVAGNRVKVLDFGIAKQVGVAGAAASDTPTAAFMTQQGMILGTINYMSPEQALGKQLDGRSDVFSLGVVLYEMATGSRPFAGETMTETMTQIIRDAQTEPMHINPGISPETNEIIQRSLRKNSGERFTAAELVTALDAQAGKARTAPYTSPNAVTAAAVAMPAAPTVLTGSKLQTVQEVPARKRSSALWLVLIFVVLAVAGLAYWLLHSGEPAKSIAAPSPSAPASQPSTTSVAVTAPPPSTIDETTATDNTGTDKPEPALGAIATGTATVAPPPSSPAKAAVGRASASSAEGDGTAPVSTPTPAFNSLSGRDRQADALYATAMSELDGGDWMQARRTLHRVLQQDPHYARAHLEMGEIALFNRNFVPASEELNQALNDADRLNAREQHIVRLLLAIASRDRTETTRLGEEMSHRWPDDPNLERLRTTFPMMFGESSRERGRRRFRQ